MPSHSLKHQKRPWCDDKQGSASIAPTPNGPLGLNATSIVFYKTHYAKMLVMQ